MHGNYVFMEKDNLVWWQSNEGIITCDSTIVMDKSKSNERERWYIALVPFMG